MDWWQLGLYAGASLLALKSLTTLMENHRNIIRRDAAVQARLRMMAQEAEEKAKAAE